MKTVFLLAIGSLLLTGCCVTAPSERRPRPVVEESVVETTRVTDERPEVATDDELYQ